MFAIELLEAREGDCIWIEYGGSDPVDRHIIVVDGGPPGAGKVLRERIERAKKERGAEQLHLELVVITHIDSDHIGGILELLTKPEPRVSIGDIWFNGVMQLSSVLGPAQGERLSTLLATDRLRWNEAFKGGRIAIPEDTGQLPHLELTGKMLVTVLGPPEDRLWKLAKGWKAVVEAAEQPVRDTGTPRKDILGEEWPPVYRDERPDIDSGPANASSILLLMEYDKKAVLLAADGSPIDLEKGIDRLLGQRGERFLPLSLFKVPHHGSEGNLTSELLRKLSCSQFALSTDGSKNKHPHHQTILRLIKEGGGTPHLMFNYRTNKTRLWEDRRDELPPGFRGYSVEYGKKGRGLVIRLK